VDIFLAGGVLRRDGAPSLPIVVEGLARISAPDPMHLGDVQTADGHLPHPMFLRDGTEMGGIDSMTK